MMLECNLNIFSLFAEAHKCTHTSAHDMIIWTEAQGTHLVLPSLSSVGWSEPVNMYFMSHDIRHILYLVLYMTSFPLNSKADFLMIILWPSEHIKVGPP